MNQMKTLKFEDVFDIGCEAKLRAIKQQGEADFASGRILDLKTTYDFALRFAETHEQAARGEFFTLGAIEMLKDICIHPQLVEGLNTIGYLMREHGQSFIEALSYRPAVFSRELTAAVKAAEQDNGNFSKHLLNFVKYRELIGALHNKFRDRDYDGLRNSLT